MTPWQVLILPPVRLRQVWKAWPRVLTGWLRQIQRENFLVQKILRRLRKMVAWAPWVTRLVDQLVRLMLPRCLMRLMLLLVPRWMALWIKVVHPHRQIRQELRPATVTGCLLKTMAQR
jgi:hypothetical protein